MRIGIVNDSSIAVETLRRAMALRPEHEVIWVAKNGVEAVELCARTTPNLVLMDLSMPEMDGVDATRLIMAKTPCPILVVTVSLGANSERAFEALGHGAVDAVDIPVLGTSDPRASAKPLLTKVDAILRGLAHENGRPRRRDHTPPMTSDSDRLVVIGASAGGPAALATVLARLPKDFPAAIVVVQHLDAQFVAGMATWLNQHSALPVRVASENDCPTPGTVLLAGTRDHLILKPTRLLGYSPEPREYIHKPSVDVFFQSVSAHWPGEVVGVLLTGMGRDGALGLKGLRNQGHYTIAQDERTSAAYGMPKAAAKLRAAVDIVPAEKIASKLAGAFACGVDAGHRHG